jgi:hypothetical protein
MINLLDLVCLAVLEFELRASHLLGRQALYHLSHSTTPIFVLDIFKIVSCELFAQGWL